MIDYIITHTFDQCIDQIFPTAWIKKEQKRTFFTIFFKIRKNGLIFTCNMSMERSWNVENRIFLHFQKLWKITFLQTKNRIWFLTFFSFSYFWLYWGNFSLLSKMDKNFIFYISRPFQRHITCKHFFWIFYGF